MALWNIAFVVFIPYGILLYFIKPNGVLIVVTSEKLLSFGIYWYAVFKSIFVKILIPASAWNAASTFGIGYESVQTLSFTPIL